MKLEILIRPDWFYPVAVLDPDSELCYSMTRHNVKVLRQAKKLGAEIRRAAKIVSEAGSPRK